MKNNKTVELRINRLNEGTHRAAKILAVHRGISLNKFVLDAIHAHTLRVAHQRGLTDSVIRAIEQPASRKARTPARPAARSRGEGQS